MTISPSVQSVQSTTKIIHKGRGKLRQYLAAFCATLCTLCSGCAMGWTATAFPYLKKTVDNNSTASNTATDSLTIDEISWITSILPIGALIGALSSGSISTRFGRKRTLLALTVPFLFGWITIVCASGSAVVFCTGRFVLGLALGADSAITPLYNEEIAEVSIRGIVGALFDCMLGSGFLWSYIFGSYIPYFWFCITSTLTPVLYFLCFVWMPESPIYLTAIGKHEEAEKSLKWLRDSENVQEELLRMQLLTERTSETKKESFSFEKFFETLKDRAVARSIKIVSGLMFFRQAAGINAILFYTVTFFKDAGSDISPFLSTVLVGTMQVIAAFLSSLLVEKTGRKLLLLISGIVSTISLIPIAVYFYLKSINIPVSTYSWSPLLFMVLYIVLFNFGWGPIPWFMMAELVPSHARSFASGFCVSVYWIMVFLVTQTFPYMVHGFGMSGTCAVFSAFCFGGVVFVAFFTIETKGKTREEIEDELRNVNQKDYVTKL